MTFLGQIWDCASAPTCDCPPIALWELLCGRANDQALGHMPGPVQYTPIYLNSFSLKKSKSPQREIFLSVVSERHCPAQDNGAWIADDIFSFTYCSFSPTALWQWDNKAFRLKPECKIIQGVHTVKDGDFMVENLVNEHNLSILAFDRCTPLIFEQSSNNLYW